MAGLNETTFDKAYKIMYNRGIEVAVLEKSPILGFMEKFKMPGKSWDFAIDIATHGASADFNTAQQQKQDSTKIAFRVTRSKVYAAGSVDGEMSETATGEGALADAVMSALDGKVNDVTHYLSHQAWSGQGGAVGQIATGGITTTAVTLTNVSDHVKFNVGDEIQASATNTDSSTARVGSATITAINRETGVLTTDVDWTTQITGLVVGDYLFKNGSVGLGAAGILSWISPDAAPGTLFGVTRTTDRNRLAGCRFDATGLDPRTAIINARAVGRENCQDVLDVMFVSPRRFADIETSLENCKSTELVGKSSGGYSIGYEAIRYGSMTIVEDHFCPHEYALMTKKRGVWKLGVTKSGLPHFHESGGRRLWPEPGEDADQFRLRGYFSPVCKSPVKNVLIGWDGFPS